MPIFEKDGREILFAHIPKTGGTSIYLAFAAAGWRVINLQPREDPQSAFHALREQFGVDRIEQRGLRIRRLGPVQHMPSAVWRLWGPFEESFAIVRHPVARLESATAYHHRLQRISEPLPDFAARVLSSAQKKILGPWRTLGGHLIPQNRFVLKDTRIFYFEEDWVQALRAGCRTLSQGERGSDRVARIPDRAADRLGPSHVQKGFCDLRIRMRQIVWAAKVFLVSSVFCGYWLGRGRRQSSSFRLGIWRIDSEAYEAERVSHPHAFSERPHPRPGPARTGRIAIVI